MEPNPIGRNEIERQRQQVTASVLAIHELHRGVLEMAAAAPMNDATNKIYRWTVGLDALLKACPAPERQGPYTIFDPSNAFNALVAWIQLMPDNPDVRNLCLDVVSALFHSRAEFLASYQDLANPPPLQPQQPQLLSSTSSQPEAPTTPPRGSRSAGPLWMSKEGKNLLCTPNSKSFAYTSSEDHLAHEFLSTVNHFLGAKTASHVKNAIIGSKTKHPAAVLKHIVGVCKETVLIASSQQQLDNSNPFVAAAGPAFNRRVRPVNPALLGHGVLFAPRSSRVRPNSNQPTSTTQTEQPQLPMQRG